MPDRPRKEKIRPSYGFPHGTFGHLLVQRYRLTITCEDCRASADSGSSDIEGQRLRGLMVQRAGERWKRRFRCPWCSGIMRPYAAHEDSWKDGWRR